MSSASRTGEDSEHMDPTLLLQYPQSHLCILPSPLAKLQLLLIGSTKFDISALRKMTQFAFRAPLETLAWRHRAGRAHGR